MLWFYTLFVEEQNFNWKCFSSHLPFTVNIGKHGMQELSFWLGGLSWDSLCTWCFHFSHQKGHNFKIKPIYLNSHRYYVVYCLCCLNNSVRIHNEMQVVYRKMTHDGAKSNVTKLNLNGGTKFKHVKNCLIFM